MAQSVERSRRATLGVIYFLSVVLMVLRVDWWWWGKKIQPLVWGWLSLPMLYQVLIWLVGTALVFWLCLSVWSKED